MLLLYLYLLVSLTLSLSLMFSFWKLLMVAILIIIIILVVVFVEQIKTRGLVIWSKKDTLVVYRGSNYQSTSKHFQKMRPGLVAGADASNSKLNQSNFEDDLTISEIKFHESTTGEKMGRKDGEEDSSPTGIFMEEMVDSQPVNGSLYEREADRLLDGLGPRFIDWWRPKPLPVDADLLPEVLPGFRPPFRLSPPQTRSKLTDDELTYLRKLAYALPTHFVLGNQPHYLNFYMLVFP